MDMIPTQTPDFFDDWIKFMEELNNKLYAELGLPFEVHETIDIPYEEVTKPQLALPPGRDDG